MALGLGAFRQFDILAHIKFEVGAGQVKVSKLQNQLDKIENTAKGINQQMKVMFSSHAISLTGAHGGVFGTLHKMVSASESYFQTQRKISTIMIANTKSQMNFNDAMRTSSAIMKSLASDAQKFAIPISDYTAVFTDLAGPMASKGVAGKNFSKTRDLAKNFMMMRHIFPNFGPHEIHNVLGGNISNRNPMWRVLRDDTKAFKTMSLGRWRAMPYGKKIDKLSEGFRQYNESNPNILESYRNSLTGQLTVLSNNFSDLTSVMKPLGDIIRSKLIEGLKHVNKWIEYKLSVSLKYLARVIEPLTGNLESLYVEFHKLQSLSESFSKSKFFSAVTFFVFEMKKFYGIIAKIGIGAGIFSVKMGAVISGGFFALLKWMTRTDTVAKALVVTFKFLGKALLSYTKFLVIFGALFRILDSARAQAKVEDLKRYSNELPAVTKKTAEVARVLASLQYPISAFINFLGKQISFLFQKTWWLEKIYNIIKNIDIISLSRNFSHGMILIATSLEQTIGSIFKLVFNVIKNPKTLLSPIKMSMDFWEDLLTNTVDKSALRIAQFDKHFDKYIKDAKKPPAPLYVNNGPITIKNQFPENLEPDRIAVSIRDSLSKSAQAQIDTNKRMQSFIPSSGYAGP